MYIKKSDQLKAWAKRAIIERKIESTRSIKSLFLIYTEGQVTEPCYFKSFPVTTETQIEIIPLGRVRTSLVEYVLADIEKRKLKQGQSDYHDSRQIWVVFDMDVKGDAKERHDFNNAIKLAKDNNIKVAYSNDAFELWFVLHDRFVNAQHHRSEYYEVLSDLLKYNYEKKGKTETEAKKLFDFFEESQHKAIKHAIAIHKQKKGETASYYLRNPCTTVYKLVMELNKCRKT